MSYVVDTDTVEFSRGRHQDHGSSVPVAVCGMPAGPTTENTYLQREPLLGSRTTTRAGHRRICGRHQHHPPPRPPGTLDQLSLRSTDRGIRRFSGHRRTEQESGVEVLDSNRVMVPDHTLRPHSGIVGVLPSRLLVQPRSFAPGPQIPGTRCVSTCPAAACHRTLRPGQFGSASLPVPAVGQIVSRVGGGRRREHTPVDTNTTRYDGGCDNFAAHHERRIPMTERVPVHTHRGRLRRQVPRPHHGNHYLPRQPEPTALDRESAPGVLQRRQTALAGLHGGPAPAFHPERLIQRPRIGAQRLLLCDLGTFPQPGDTPARFGQHSRQLPESGCTAGALLVDGFVPQEAASMPLRVQRPTRVCTRTQAIGVAHDFPHTRQHTASNCLLLSWDARPYLATCDYPSVVHRSSGNNDRSDRPSANLRRYCVPGAPPPILARHPTDQFVFRRLSRRSNPERMNAMPTTRTPAPRSVLAPGSGRFLGSIR